MRLSLGVTAHIHQSESARTRWYRRYGLNIIALAACIMMALLVMEQRRVIDNQRTLIRHLFSDSLELTALKFRDIREGRK